MIQTTALKLRRFGAVTLIGLTLGHSGTGAAEGFLPDKQEILMMPPLCQWMYGARAGLDPALIPKGPPMDVSGCTRFHYYCDANTDLVRAEKSAFTNPGRAKEKLSRAINTLQGQVQFHNAEPGCSKYLRADISYTLGRALVRYARLTRASNYYAEAIGPLQQAIALTPEDARPYEALGDAYAALHKRQQAEEAVYSGLQVNPESRPLLRRYKELGGKRPLPIAKPAAPVEAEGSAAVSGSAAMQGDTQPAGDSGVPHPLDTAAVAGAAQSAEASPPVQDKPAPNRYCRFCPDADSGANKASPASGQAESPKPGTGDLPCRFCP